MRHSRTAALLLCVLPSLAGQTINDLFDGQELHDVRVSIDPADWQTLKDHYLENTYYKCDFQWRGITLSNCGIRSRGSGSRTPIKPGLTIDFSRNVSTQRLLGLKSVVLRNLAQDDTGMRERLAEMLFARMGLPYSREAYARLFINGEYAGLYLMVEPIDKRFLLTRFGEDTGYLYEMQPWTGYRFEYRGEDPALYVPALFDPKTHEDESHTELVEFVRAINETSDAEFAAVISRYLDLNAFATHLACEQYVTNWDSILGDDGMNNFYMYRRMSDNRYTFLVWDEDAALSLPQLPIWHGVDGNVLARRVLAVPAAHRRYVEALRQAAETATNQDWLHQQAEFVYGQIRQAVREDPNRVCTTDGVIHRCDAETFESGMEEVREFFQYRAPYVTAAVTPILGAIMQPWLHQGDVINYASQEPVLTSGSLGEVHLDGDWNIATWATGYPLPKILSGVSVTVGGVEAPLTAVTSGAAVFQVPLETRYGPIAVNLVHDGQVSNTVTVENRPSCPGVFAVMHATNIQVATWAPITPGETLVIYATGLGPPPSGVGTGWGAPVDALVSFRESLGVTISGQAARVIWAGLSPGLAGVYVVIVEVPADLSTSSAMADLVLTVNGEPGSAYRLAVTAR